MNTDIKPIIEAIKSAKPEFADATDGQIMMYYRHLTVEQRKQFKIEKGKTDVTSNGPDGDI